MINFIIKKWIEPYKLLEAIKTHSVMDEYSFDGTNKQILKEHFIKSLKNDKDFGLYMKNVNKFYVFDSNENIREILKKEFELNESDYIVTEEENRSFDDIDSGKAEAAILMY